MSGKHQKERLRANGRYAVGLVNTQERSMGDGYISLSDMKCRYLTFNSEWWVFAAEFALITHYKPEWNASGFGGKYRVPGAPAQHA